MKLLAFTEAEMGFQPTPSNLSARPTDTCAQREDYQISPDEADKMGHPYT
jgi:hypothetical protein